MMTNKLKFGDVVLLRFPYTDGKSYKRRPALVIRDTMDGDIIVCRITSRIYSSEFDIVVDAWQECGLKSLSVIRVHKLASLDVSIVDHKIGRITRDLKVRTKHMLAEIAN